MTSSPFRRCSALTILGFGVAAMTASGCAALTVNSYLERGADLHQYRTYDWAPAREQATGDPRLDNNELFDERVRMDIARAMERRGFERVSGHEPQLLVRYYVRVREELDANGTDQ